MASEQFSLCWDNFHKNMSSGMNSLLENEDLVDVTLAVEGKYLKAHKMVLSVCSPYFRELFKVNPCKHPIVFMKDVSYVAMSDLLQFMYQGEVQVSQENLTTFIKTAEALQIKGLTGDGNGSAECDNDQDEPKPTDVELPKPTPRPMKKVHQVPTPPAKRPRLSAPEPSAPPAVTKTEPAAVSSASNNDQLIQFKMEPYDQGQSTVTIPDDNADETFTDDPLDETNADDGNEDYSMMEGGDEEPQAGTSADGTAGEGQGFSSKSTNATDSLMRDLSRNSFYCNLGRSDYDKSTDSSVDDSDDSTANETDIKKQLRSIKNAVEKNRKLLKLQNQNFEQLRMELLEHNENMRGMFQVFTNRNVVDKNIVKDNLFEMARLPMSDHHSLKSWNGLLMDEQYMEQTAIRLKNCISLTHSLKKCVKDLMENIVTYDLLILHSWSGKVWSKSDKTKLVFSEYTGVLRLIFTTIQLVRSDTEIEIKKALVDCLKRSTQNYQRRNQSMSRQQNIYADVFQDTKR